MLVVLCFVGLDCVALCCVVLHSIALGWVRLCCVCAWMCSVINANSDCITPSYSYPRERSTPLYTLSMCSITKTNLSYHACAMLCCASNVGPVQILRIPTIHAVPCHYGANFGLLSSAMIDFLRTYWQPSSYFVYVHVSDNKWPHSLFVWAPLTIIFIALLILSLASLLRSWDASF